AVTVSKASVADLAARGAVLAVAMGGLLRAGRRPELVICANTGAASLPPICYAAPAKSTGTMLHRRRSAVVERIETKARSAPVNHVFHILMGAKPQDAALY